MTLRGECNGTTEGVVAMKLPSKHFASGDYEVALMELQMPKPKYKSSLREEFIWSVKGSRDKRLTVSGEDLLRYLHETKKVCIPNHLDVAFEVKCEKESRSCTLTVPDGNTVRFVDENAFLSRILGFESGTYSNQIVKSQKEYGKAVYRQMVHIDCDILEKTAFGESYRQHLRSIPVHDTGTWYEFSHPQFYPVREYSFSEIVLSFYSDLFTEDKVFLPDGTVQATLLFRQIK